MSAALKTPELSSEALAFIRGPTAAAAPVPAKPSETPIRREPDLVLDEEVSTTTAVPPKQAVAQSTNRLPVMVGLSTRISADLQQALMRVSFERKLARHEPWTLQDIVTEALTGWLKKNKVN